MNIAIQKGLERLKTQLESRGHHVSYIGENNLADAILYKEVDMYPYYEANNVPSAFTSGFEYNAAYGALLVNATNKSLEEILEILAKRVYSPLF